MQKIRSYLSPALSLERQVANPRRSQVCASRTLDELHQTWRMNKLLVVIMTEQVALDIALADESAQPFLNRCCDA